VVAHRERGLFVKGVRQPLARYRNWPDQISRNKVQMSEANIRVLEKALARPQRATRRHAYEYSLQIARGNLELARARPLIEIHPGAVPAAAFARLAVLSDPSQMAALVFCRVVAKLAVGGNCPSQKSKENGDFTPTYCLLHFLPAAGCDLRVPL